MALSVRHSPYSIPSSRFNSMPSYNSSFNSPGTIPEASTYNMPSSSRFGLQSSMFSSVSPLTTSGTALHGNISPAMNLLPTAMNSSSPPGMDSTSEMSCLSDTSVPEHSEARCSSESPVSPPDVSVKSPHLSTDPYKYGGYSSLPPHPSLSTFTNSMLNGGLSPPPLPVPGPPLPYPAAAAPTTMLPTPMYSTQDYSSPSLSNSMPSLSVPKWSSLLNVGPIPSPSIPKLSYDSPRYKLTPERAIPLIKWFEEHKEHPYPTRHEKIVLCQSTRLTFTQVSTWFANARRRMKKVVSEEDDTCSSQSSGSGSDHEGSPATKELK